MRLTLRTLLAYLDDTLDPIQTKQIGQKVAESDSAQELIARIKQVTRRRSLTTPQSGETAVDPNLVADYLDNTLPPEQVAQVEKICLESDVHLAEVSACHQILTLVLGEPANVPPSSRQRMYKLVKGPEAIHSRKAPAYQPASEADAIVDERDETDEALLLGLPAYQPKGSWRRRVLPAAALLLLAGGLAFVLYQAIAGRNGETVAHRWGEPRPDLRGKVAPAQAVEWEQVASREVGPVMAVSSSLLALATPRVELPDAAELPPDSPPVVPEQPPAVKPEKTAKPTANASSAPPPNIQVVEVGTHSTRSLLVAKVGENDWRWLRQGTRVNSSQPLVALPGYRSEIQLDRKVRLELVGNLPEITSNPVFESAVVLHDNAQFDVDLTLERGRIVVSSMKKETPTTIRIRFHDEAWDIKLLEPDSTVGLELTGRIDRGSKERWPTRAKLSLAITGGPIELKRGDRTEHFVENKLLPWDNLLSASKMLTPVFPLPRPPAWMPRGTKVSEDVRVALNNLDRRFSEKLDGLIRPQESLRWMRLAFTELQSENRRVDRRLALFGLAAIDQLDRVLASLEDTERTEVRDAALIALLHWLGRKPDQDRELRPFLRERGYADEDAVTFVRLIRNADEGTPTTFQFLIDCLGNGRLPIRELAIMNLYQLVPPGQRIPFDPAGSEEQRDKAIEAWKARLPARPPEDK